MKLTYDQKAFSVLCLSILAFVFYTLFCQRRRKKASYKLNSVILCIILFVQALPYYMHYMHTLSGDVQQKQPTGTSATSASSLASLAKNISNIITVDNFVPDVCTELPLAFDKEALKASKRWKERTLKLGKETAASFLEYFDAHNTFLQEGWVLSKPFEGRLQGEELFTKQALRDKDLQNLPMRQIFETKRRWAGTDFNPKIFTWFLTNVLEKHRKEWIQFECKRRRAPWEWRQEGNFMFATQDARVLHSVVREFKPKKVVEIGSGYSTRVGTAAMVLNKEEGYPGEYLVIEPFLNRVPDPLPGLCRPQCIIQNFMEQVPLSTFTSLQSGDILFIDSSHIVGRQHDAITGLSMVWRDVAIEINELIPRLQPGVIVHVHDVPFPLQFWYKERYYIEQFMVQALLQNNKYLEPLWFGGAAGGWFEPMDEIEREGLLLELDRLLLATDPKVVIYDVSNMSLPGASFSGGGSIYFRRTQEVYTGPTCPVELDAKGKCNVALETVFDKYRTWGGMGKDDFDKALFKELRAVSKKGTFSQQGALTCAALKLYNITNVLELCGPEPKACVTAGDDGQAGHHSKLLECAPDAVVTRGEIASMKLREFQKLGEGSMVVFMLTSDQQQARYPHDAVLIFVSEVLPRLNKGVVVGIFGVPFPAHRNYDKKSPVGDASQMLIQAAIMHNTMYKVMRVSDGMMILRRE